MTGLIRRDIFGFRNVVIAGNMAHAGIKGGTGVADYCARIAEGRYGKCSVYWGCHGCVLEPGHEWEAYERVHVCKCGKISSAMSILWGSGMNEGELGDVELKIEVGREFELAKKTGRPKGSRNGTSFGIIIGTPVGDVVTKAPEKKKTRAKKKEEKK